MFQPLTTPFSEPVSEASFPYLDGHTTFDRPLVVQFCANDPEDLLHAGQFAAPYCDAVDLNLGCPQGIAKRGHYGAFLQEDWGIISSVIRRCHDALDVPITAKMRILDAPEHTLAYARMILASGASILSVHGRTRAQKGHNTGLADWDVIRYLRDNLPPETVLFANGNIRCHDDIAACLEATGADAVMSAQASLRDPAVFFPPPTADFGSRSGYYKSAERSGWRLDFVFRRYLDLTNLFVMHRPSPVRATSELEPVLPAWITEGLRSWHARDVRPPFTEMKRNCNLHPMKSHMFSLFEEMLRLPQNVHIRDQISRIHTGDLDKYESVLAMIEQAVEQGIAAHVPGGRVWWVCGEDLTLSARSNADPL